MTAEQEALARKVRWHQLLSAFLDGSAQIKRASLWTLPIGTAIGLLSLIIVSVVSMIGATRAEADDVRRERLGVPLDVAAAPADGAVTVTWQPPTRLADGVGISGYEVVASDGGGVVRSASASTAATVHGLDNRTPYTFTVKVLSGDQEGSPSPATAPVTPSSGLAAPPDAPAALVAVAGNGSANVEWAAPVADGGSPVTGYTITATPGGAFVRVGAARRTATVHGLDNDRDYTLTVVAASNVAFSRPSDTSDPVTPRDVLAKAPATPLDVVAEPAPAAMSVSWAPVVASEESGDVRGYVVTSFPDGIVAGVPPTASSVTVNGLDPSIAYSFTVSSINDAGESVPSDPTLPAPPLPAAG